MCHGINDIYILGEFKQSIGMRIFVLPMLKLNSGHLNGVYGYI